ncbi:MAG: putative baseplate assembly protein, partial [Rhodothermales bacterium]|nr:putative baseplate assembly protein [Rhodothermales bacterium]
ADPGNENWDVRKLTAVTLDRERDLTTAEWERGLGSFVPFVRPAAEPRVYVFRTRAALFGHNAADWNAMPDAVRDRYAGTADADDFDDWPGLTISGVNDGDDSDSIVYLDALYPEIVPESWVVLTRPVAPGVSGYAEVYRVEAADEAARSAFTLSAKTTRLTLDGEDLDRRFGAYLRSVVVYGESEELTVAEEPVADPASGATVELDALVEGLAEGQRVAVTGFDAATGAAAAEVATIKTVGVTDGVTVLTFEDALEGVYDREAVFFNANVAPATHGKTIAHEVLGSGDGSVPFQRFTLKEPPLTYVSAPTASGTASTLEVRVDGVRWQEVPTLYEQPATARVYVTRRADDGTVTVRFGDGLHGARLPTGSENVTATYRTGIGLDGLVDAGQISLLMTRPLGVKDVANPEMPTGAADPEALAEARQNAPLTVLTLDRIVSVQDFEDFARAFAGIGKAQATLLWSGERQLVYLTVAGADGGPVPEDSDLYANLRDAIDAARHVDEEVRIATYAPLLFGVEARVLVDEAHIEADVLAAVEAALAGEFAFEERAFGQAVTASEVLAAMQAVEGVVAVDLDALGGRDPFAFPRLLARTARWESSAVQPAELLLIDPDAVTLTPMTP